MNAYRESLAIVAAHCHPVGAGTVPFREAAGRVAAEAVVAAGDDPPAATSAMDGYAVRAADTAGASPAAPVRLPCRQHVAAGHAPEAPLAPGEAARILTGARLPAGADAVIRQEDVAGAGEPGHIALHRPAAPGDHVTAPGARLTRGDVLLHAGEVLRPQAVGLLAAQGRTTARVFRRPRVALLALGDELVEPGRPLAPGQLHVSNLYALEAEVCRDGGEPVSLGIAPDDPEAIAERLRPHVAPGPDGGEPGGGACDLVLTLGGSHRGDRDFAGPVMEALGARVQFERTRFAPGGSTRFATRGRTLWFALPGTPLASQVAYAVLARPALWRVAGRARLEPLWLEAMLADAVSRRPGRTHFVPVRLRGAPGQPPEAVPLDERPAGGRPPALLADGLVVLPEEADTVPSGERVPVMLL